FGRDDQHAIGAIAELQSYSVRDCSGNSRSANTCVCRWAGRDGACARVVGSGRRAFAVALVGTHEARRGRAGLALCRGPSKGFTHMAVLSANASTDMWADIYNLMLDNLYSQPFSYDSNHLAYYGVTFYGSFYWAGARFAGTVTAIQTSN